MKEVGSKHKKRSQNTHLERNRSLFQARWRWPMNERIARYRIPNFKLGNIASVDDPLARVDPLTLTKDRHIIVCTYYTLKLEMRKRIYLQETLIAAHTTQRFLSTNHTCHASVRTRNTLRTTLVSNSNVSEIYATSCVRIVASGSRLDTDTSMVSTTFTGTH